MTTRALDLGKGGLFVETDRPLQVGKRLSLEIQVGGELAPWPALGRVVWLREAGALGGPPGMGVAFIALDDAVVAAIDRVLGPLVARQATESGTGSPRSAPPRERTELGVGPPARASSPAAPAIPTAPVVAAAPAREETLLGVGAARAQEKTLPGDLDDERAWDVDDPPTVQADRPVEPARAKRAPQAPAAEQSVAIDLVARRPSGEPRAIEPDRESSMAPAGVPRRGRMRWPLFLLFGAAAAAGYGFRVRVRPLVEPYVRKAVAMVSVAIDGPTPRPTPPPAVTSASPVPSAMPTQALTAGAPPAAPAASKASDASTSDGAPSAVQSAVTSGPKAPPPRRPAPPPPTPAPPATRQAEGDNPY